MKGGNNSLLKELQAKIKERIAQIHAIADDIPGVIIIHNVQTRFVEYMSPRGLKELKCTIKELKDMGADYHLRFFNPDDSLDYVPKIFSQIERNDDSIVSFFQQVRPNVKHDFVWHFSAIKIFMHDDEGKPLLTITVAHPVDPKAHFTSKISRLLEENNFLKKHHHEFNELTKREKEVLKYTVLGLSAADVAKELFISQNTVETHKRNIKKKLQADSFYKLSQYARAFDLI